MNNISKVRKHATKRVSLAKRVEETSDFPDPLSLFSLYRAIVRNDTVNTMIGDSFCPFRGRNIETSYKTDPNERAYNKDYDFWIRTLRRFLNCQPIVEYNSDTQQTVQLTKFGKYIFPYLMKVFEDLYLNNDFLKEAVAEWESKLKRKKSNE